MAGSLSIALNSPHRTFAPGVADDRTQPFQDIRSAPASRGLSYRLGGERTFAALVTNGSSAQIAHFAKSSDLAAWRALIAADA